MSWFQRAVKAGVEEAVHETLRKVVPGLVEAAVIQFLDETLAPGRRLTQHGFILAMAVTLHKHGMPFLAAKHRASDALSEFLKDERIRFGDPDYVWDRGGAEAVITAYELDHWEAAA